MILYVINKEPYDEDDLYNFVYDSKEKAFKAWKALFYGVETDLEGDSIEECFEKGGALFYDRHLRWQAVNLNEKLEG